MLRSDTSGGHKYAIHNVELDIVGKAFRKVNHSLQCHGVISKYGGYDTGISGQMFLQRDNSYCKNELSVLSRTEGGLAAILYETLISPLWNFYDFYPWLYVSMSK